MKQEAHWLKTMGSSQMFKFSVKHQEIPNAENDLYEGRGRRCETDLE